MKSWLRIAHRGASGHAPEHTRAAFELAVAQGAQMVELDVRLTADGELVVFHDDTLERTTNGVGKVSEKTWAQLRDLDAGSWFGRQFAGERLLLLQEVLRLLAGRVLLNVELKEHASKASLLLPALLSRLGEEGAEQRVVVSAFDWELLAKLRAYDPGVRIGILWHEPSRTEDVWRFAEQIGAYSVHPLWLLVEPGLIAAAHERGLQVFTWTVNDPAQVRSQVALGVDGVISDYPDRLLAVARVDPRREDD